MSYKLETRAFFFNAKTDYLPYYKNFSITVDADATAKDILTAIQAQNENFSYPALNLVFKINGLVVEGNQAVSTIVERLGTSLQIDSVNSYRSNNGLNINDDDFMQSFAILEPYATEQHLAYYKTLYALHYASETENFEHAYIGDAILLLAHKMISEHSEHKDAILDAITSAYSGLLDCEYENNLFNTQKHDETITALKTMIQPKQKLSLLSIFSKNYNSVDTIDNLEEKQIAYYVGPAIIDQTTAMEQMIGNMGSNVITFARTKKLSGFTLVNDNLPLALEKAGTTLLDAFDSGAEVLVVEDEKTLAMFIQYFSKIEKIMGREMIGFELISAKNFALQAKAIAV